MCGRCGGELCADDVVMFTGFITFFGHVCDVNECAYGVWTFWWLCWVMFMFCKDT